MTETKFIPELLPSGNATCETEEHRIAREAQYIRDYYKALGARYFELTGEDLDNG